MSPAPVVQRPISTGNVPGRQRTDIDSTLELTADGFKMMLLSADKFLTASRSDSVNESLGLEFAGTIGAIVGGVIDEYEITVGVTNVTGRLRGRDSAAALLDSTYDHIYQRPATTLPNAGPIETVPAPLGTPQTSIGIFTAQQIASDAVASMNAGLRLSWEVPNYTILIPTFQVSGRVVDILRSLAAPWSQVEPFKVDIIAEGTTVIVRNRSIAGSANFTLDAVGSRQSSITVRKRPLRLFGTVVLRGMHDPSNQQTPPPGTTPPPDPNVPPPQGTSIETSTNEIFDQTGARTSTITTVNTYQTPERLLLNSIKTEIVYDQSGSARLGSRETTVKTYERTVRDSRGALNSPKPLTSYTRTEKFDPDTGTLKESSTEEADYTYDSMGFQSAETVIRKTLDTSLTPAVMKNSEMLVSTLQDIGALLVEKVTSKYVWNTDDGESLGKWVLSRRDTQQSGGHRPGGPNRGQSTAGTTAFTPGSGGTAAGNQIVITRTFHTGPKTLNVTYSNENLTAAQLQIIMNQFAAADGLWEYELIFSGVSMPWLRRGQSVQVVNIPVSGSQNYATPVGLILEVRTSYDESTKTPGMLQNVRAFGYASS
jgi:hypothetical protein